jgi:dTDP-4-dehydrorhamnose reductase
VSRILLFGANGQVGWELQRALAPLGEMTICDRATADLANPQRLAELIRAGNPGFIVNAAAYTAVDKAESDIGNARIINADAVATLAREARSIGAWLIHYSTDYVFDGTGQGAYREDAPANPLNVYGSTKLEGEHAIAASGCRHLIFRTSWVYAVRGANFAKTMLRLAKERDRLDVVADQFGAPTSAELIADVTAQVLQRLRTQGESFAKQDGIYHLAAAGRTSWYSYAKFVIEEAVKLGHPFRATPDAINPVPAVDYPLPARRPQNSCLDSGKLQRTFELTLPHWEYHALRMIKELSDMKAI